MADGIHQTMTGSEAFALLVAAKGRPVEGESVVVSAARRTIRDHERDPMDGTIRMFGGRDESRLASAISRIDPADSSLLGVEARLKADVAIQRMGVQRDREVASHSRHAGFERRDRDAVHGDVSKLAGERSHFSVGALAMGKFERANPDLRDWVRDSVGFAAREAEARDRGGEGARMASIGAFSRPSGLAAQAASAGPAPDGAAPSDLSRGRAAAGVEAQRIHLDGGRGR